MPPHLETQTQQQITECSKKLPNPHTPKRAGFKSDAPNATGLPTATCFYYKRPGQVYALLGHARMHGGVLQFNTAPADAHIKENRAARPFWQLHMASQSTSRRKLNHAANAPFAGSLIQSQANSRCCPTCCASVAQNQVAVPCKPRKIPHRSH